MIGCKICGSRTDIFGEATVLQRYTASYVRCAECGFIFPPTPHWLTEAYHSSITASDIGLVGRNIAFAKQTQVLISAFFSASGRFVDFGGGYGMFVRLMRDAGYAFYRQDKYCENLFAQHFEAEMTPTQGSYELLTAIEVFEHLEDPWAGIAEMRQYADSILFTTQLVPNPIPALNDWWYFGLEHGQHVSLFSLGTLQAIAERLDCNLYSDGASIHLLTPKRISSILFRLLISSKLVALISPFIRRPSLIFDDFRQITHQKLS